MASSSSTRPYALGRRVEHDPRSLAFPATVAAQAAVRTKSWRHWGPILDQGSLGSCTGNATCQALNTVPLRHSRRLLDEGDAVDVYSRATVIDGFPGEWPPEDTGSSGLAAAKVAKERGWISGYDHAFGLDHALGALMISPFIMGTNWYRGMFEPNATGVVEISGPVEGGHEYEIHAANLEQRYVCAINSWGRGWGLGGHFRMSFDTLRRLLAEDGDATVLVR